MNDRPIILAVDDNPADLALLAKMLTPAGYQVHPVDSGELALAAVAANPPDLILLDLRMQGVDGFEVCRRLQAREETRHIPIIMVSAFAEAKEWVEGLQLGAADYITKPFQREELLTRVKTHLSLSRATVSLEQQTAALLQANEQLQSEIAERKRTEVALRRLATAVNQAAEAIMITDLAGTIQYVNPAFERITGYTSAEAIGQNPRFLKSGQQDPEVYRRLWQTITAGEVWSDHFANKRKDGTFYEEEMTISPVRDDQGRITNFIAVKEDVTARVRAEEALRESQARIQSILDNSSTVIFLKDLESRYITINRRYEELFHVTRQTVVGKSDYDIFPREIADRFRQHDLLALEKGGPIEIDEVVPHDDGLHTYISVKFPLFGADGEAYAVCGIATDITERVRGEEARAQLEAQLHLMQKMDALGTLSGGIAHDFNNILGAIIGNAELARQDASANRRAMESLDEILKASHRARDLVQRILAFASQHQEPRIVIPLRPVVEEALTILRVRLPAAAEIAAAFDAGAPTVRADSTQIQQVLIDLCTNAWQAMEGHTGRIDIGLDGVTLDAEAARANANLRPGYFARLCVTDTGAGMDAATLARMFEPFFTTNPVGQGTGLGLSVVHGIVKSHDGTITVSSEPGKGTTFTLYFPAAEAPEQSAEPQAAATKPIPEAGGQHVLYLDDEEALVFLVTRTLERLGYRVSGYTRAEDALAAVRADPGQFDLVVTDFNMPGMSGLEVARELARLRPDLPVVLASGDITGDLRAQAPKAGVRQLIYKPNTVEELCAAVQRLVGQPRRSAA